MQNSYHLGLYEKSMPGTLTLSQKLKQTNKAGFDFMEISIDETDEKLARLDWSRQERTELVLAMAETGVGIRTMCLSGHRKYPLGSEDAAVRARGLEIMEKAILLASELGIRIIQLAGYDEYYKPSNENTRRLFAENLRLSVDMAAKYGIVLAFETMETEFMNTCQKAMRYVSQIDSPYLQVYPDIGNLTNAAKTYGHSVQDDLAVARGHISALHLKETVPGKFREIPYGTGHTDFVSAIRTVREMGVQLFLAEFWYVGNDDWEQQLEAANHFLREKFAAAAR